MNTLTDLRLDNVTLRNEYNAELLLSIVKRFKNKLDKDGVEVRLILEATQDTIEELENGKTTLESFYGDIDVCFDKYDTWLKGYKEHKSDWKMESHFRVHLVLPISLLLVIYIVKHQDYTPGTDLLDFDKQLEPFHKVVYGGDQ